MKQRGCTRIYSDGGEVGAYIGYVKKSKGCDEKIQKKMQDIDAI